MNAHPYGCSCPECRVEHYRPGDDYDRLPDTPAEPVRTEVEAAIRNALAPVLGWYQPDDAPERPTHDIVRDVVADLQADRAETLRLHAALGQIVKFGYANSGCGFSCARMAESALKGEGA